MKGKVKAVLMSENGKEVLLGKLEPGDHFGAASIFLQLPESIAIITLEDSEFLVIPPNILMYEIEKDPQIAIHLLFNMSKKLRDSIELIHDLAFLSAKQRVAKALLNYSCENPGEKDDGIMEFKRPPMKDIAACACTSRETASRILREFSEKKLLSMYKKNIFISKELRTNQAK
jgi:CRP-like cAMP-binding protein